jgi:hypothetical protein
MDIAATPIIFIKQAKIKPTHISVNKVCIFELQRQDIAVLNAATRLALAKTADSARSALAAT